MHYLLRSFYILFILCFSAGQLHSQSLYDLEWTHNGTFYHGLMVYFNENEVHIRIGFEEEDAYNVMEGQYAFQTDQDFGEFLLLEVISTEFIQNEGGFLEDEFHFLWFDDGNQEMDGPFAVSDYDLEHDIDKEPDLVTIIELPPDSMTADYLLQYYLPEEEEYGQLIHSGVQEAYVTESGKAQVNLHFIVAANTHISDIGSSTKMDMDNLSSEFSEIAEVLKMNFVRTEISGKEFTKANLKRELGKLAPSSDDIVIFYYSGHGFRYDDQSQKYPELDLRYNAYQETGINNSMNLEEVFEAVTAKGARLNILLGDCCNNTIGLNKRVGTSFLGSRATINAAILKLERLFLKSEGDLIAAGADVGQYSWCSSQGGFFSNSLIDALREESSTLKSQDVPNWEEILENTSRSTLKKSQLCKECDTQNAIFEETIK